MLKKITAVATAAVATGGLTVALLAPLAPVSAAPDTSGKALPQPNKNAFGLTKDGKLVTFKLGAAQQATSVGKVRGLDGDSRVVGMDLRPATGAIFALGDQGGVYTLNKKNARATLVDRLTEDLEGRNFDVDWNPTVDALRIVSDEGQNLRYSPAAGTTTADTDLNVPDTTDRLEGITAAAYTNNDASDRSGTSLFDLNTAADSLVLQIPANAGTITSQGPTRVPAFADAGFDILTEVKGGLAVNNTGYATLGTKKGYALYKINLTSGKATKIRAFPRNLQVSDLTISR